MSRRRVAVTGIGMVSPIGGSAAECWDACLAGRAAVSPIPDQWRRWNGFQSTVWAPLPKGDFEAAGITSLEAMRLDRAAMLAVVAAGEALADAGLEASLADAKRGIWRLAGVDCDRAGVFMGTAVGGITTLINSQNSHLLGPVQPLKSLGEPGALDPATDALDTLLASLPRRFNPFAVSMIMPNAVSATLGIRYSLRGPNATCSVACAAGTAAVGHAFRSIRGGDTDMFLCGGAEFVGDPFGGVFRAFDTAKTLVSVVDRPETANRPFDRSCNGIPPSGRGRGGAHLRGMGACPPPRRPDPRRDRRVWRVVRRLQHDDHGTGGRAAGADHQRGARSRDYRLVTTRSEGARVRELGGFGTAAELRAASDRRPAGVGGLAVLRPWRAQCNGRDTPGRVLSGVPATRK